MITVKEATEISLSSLNDEKKAELSESLDGLIRSYAAKGSRVLSVERSNFTQVEFEFLKLELERHGFSVSEVGFTIYW